MSKIWVLGWDFHDEGKSVPVAAYLTKGAALEAKDLVESNPSATAVYLVDLQLMTSRESVRASVDTKEKHRRASRDGMRRQRAKSVERRADA